MNPRHLLAILLGAVLVIGTGSFVVAAEPDRIIQTLAIGGVQPYDQPVSVGTGVVEIRLTTSLTCAPPEGKVGCGVVVSAILHSPVVDPYNPETFPLYADVLDQTSSMLCKGTFAVGCQSEGPVDEFVYQFNVPRPGRYTLVTFSKVGFDYESSDIRLTTDHPVTVGAEVYPELGVIYEIIGYANIDVYQTRTA